MNPNWSLNPQTESSKEFMSNVEASDIAFEKEQEEKEQQLAQQKADERYERIMSSDINKAISGTQAAADLTFAGGVASGNPLATLYGGIVSGGVDAGRYLGSKVMGMLHPDEDWSKYTQKHAIGSAMNLAPTKGVKSVIEGGEKIVAAYKGGKAVHKTIKHAQTYGEQLANLINEWEGKTEEDEDTKQLAQLVRGGKINHNPKDYYSDGYKKYLGGGKIEKKYKTGGVTPGKFSHKENPLKVVDKKGNDTGMELTGGEGVFDQNAMNMLDKYKRNKDYNKAGKLVFKEMNSWKDTGTAKYGTKIKYK